MHAAHSVQVTEGAANQYHASRVPHCGLLVGAAGVVVVDQPYDFIPLRYVIEWDALAFGRGTGWFATVLAPRRTDELEDRVHRPTRDRELEDELLAENAVLSRISCAARD